MTTIEFSQNEITIITNVISNIIANYHRGEGIDVTKLGLPLSAAKEFIAGCEPKSVRCNKGGYIPDEQVLAFLYTKLIKASSVDKPTSLKDDDIISPLIKAGLVVKIKSVLPLEIIGGRSIDESGGLIVYKDAFRIWEGYSNGNIGKTKTFFANKTKEKNVPYVFGSLDFAIACMVGLYTMKSPGTKR